MFADIAVIEVRDAESSTVVRAADADSPVSPDSPLGPDCITLPDRSNSQGATVETGEVVSVPASELGCMRVDGGILQGGDTIMHRRDGALMVEAGQPYSLRWPLLTVLTRLRIHGGEGRCPVATVVDQPPPSNALAACQNFISAIDSRQLHFYGSQDYTALLQQLDNSSPFAFTLCKGTCPPNTESPPVADAGAPADAGLQIPPLPTYP